MPKREATANRGRNANANGPRQWERSLNDGGLALANTNAWNVPLDKMRSIGWFSLNVRSIPSAAVHLV